LKQYTRLGISGLLAVVALFVVSCGGGGESGGQSSETEGAKNSEMTKSSGSTAEETGSIETTQSMEGGSSEVEAMLMKDGEYSDELFIDTMVPHHAGAVDMAKVALKNAEHPETTQLAKDIVSAQQVEIDEMKSIKKEEFGTSEVPMSMNMDDMMNMGMMMNPEDLAKEDPFDKAFIDNMIPHHQSAIEMAQVALQNTSNPRITELAGNIVRDQRREIAQMKQWRQEWY
jgi:uncharacterized protein (DUF305 family)